MVQGHFSGSPNKQSVGLIAMLARRGRPIHSTLIGLFASVIALLVCAVGASADGTLRLALVSFPPGGADPRKLINAMGAYAWSPALDALTAFSESSQLLPELAVSWNSPNPNTWVIKLRPGVNFSNGRPCDAEAVASNFTWLLTQEGRASVVGRMLDAVKAVRVLDSLTIEITTSKPDALLPRELSAFYIVEPQQWTKLGPDGFAKAPVGTGSFTLESWGPAQITYVANPRSWRPPKLSRLELLDLPDLTARLQALLTKRVDVAVGMGPDERPEIERAGGHLHQRAPMDVISVVFVIGEGKPADDVRVRQALNYAVNKEAITTVLLHGLSEPSSQGAVRGLFGYDSDLKPYPYDPAKARALLKESGFGNGFALNTEILVSQNVGDTAVYQMVAADLAAVGVKMNLIPIPSAQMINVINQGGWKGDAFSQIFGAIPTLDPLRTLRLHSCLWPKPWYCDAGITAKLEATLQEFNDEKRAAMTRDILKFYHDQATALLLYDIPVLDGVISRVHNYDPQRTRINYETISVE